MASIISKNPIYIENLILIYLDEIFNETQNLFQSFVNTTKFFFNSQQCRQFIDKIIDEKLFVIISDSFDEKFIYELENKSQIYAIYIYSHQKKWTRKDFSKIKGFYTDYHSIFNAFRRDFRQLNNDLLSINILSTIDSHQSFMCSLLLKDIVINIPSNNQMKKEFIEYIRLHSQQIDLINQYEQNDYNKITPIEWYTRESFIYSIINRALRLYDIEILYKITFFIQDLNKQIQDLHMKSIDSKNFIVYYGQGISNDQLENLKMNVNTLVSFNGFLLTTIDKELSFHFAKQSGNNPKLISILYQIEIDRSKSSTSFVLLNEFDYYHDTDQHLLFSLTSIFRIIKIEQIEDKFWQINLILIDNNEKQLQDLIHLNRKSKSFISLGQMLFRMNDFNKAKNIFQVLLQNTNTNNQKELITIHRMLGRICQKTEDFVNALFHYQECMKIELTHFSSNNSLLSITLASIGAIFEKLGNLNQALEYFKRAADNNHKINSTILVFYYISIGRILYKQGENIEARKNFELALKFEQKSLVHNNNFLAEIHHYLTIVS